MMSEYTYDEVNRQVVEAPDSLILVTGGAGTGKTRAAIQRAEWIAENLGLREGQRILFLSFSRASKARMRQAVRLHAPALAPLSEVVTFDSVCRSLVVRYGQWLGLSGQLRISQRDRSEFDYHHEPTEDGHYATFDDIRGLALRVMMRDDVAHGLADAYPHVLVDEFQDTREHHYRLLMCLWPSSSISAFGDPHQDIQPGGGIFDALGSLKEDGAKCWRLTSQMRQPEWLRRFAEAIRDDDPQLITKRPKATAYGKPPFLRACIHRDLQNAYRLGQSVAVLTLKTDRALGIARLLGQDMTTQGGDYYHRWPVQVDCSESSFDAHLATIELVWQALLEPGDEICELAQESLCEVTTGRTVSGKRSAVKKAFSALRVSHVVGAVAGSTTGSPAEDFELAASVVTTLHDALGERRAPECDMLVEAVQQTVAHMPSDAEVMTSADVRHAMQRARVARMAQRDLARVGATSLVRVMNVHQAKNREFDCVVFVYDARDAYGCAASEEAYERHRMLLYQAASRAKQNLVVYYWSGTKEMGQPLGPCLSKMLR